MSSPGQQGKKCLLRNIILLLVASDYSKIMPVLLWMLCLSKTESFCYKTFLKQLYDKVLLKEGTFFKEYLVGNFGFLNYK